MICRNYEWIFSGTFLTTLYNKCLQSTNARKCSYRLHCHFFGLWFKCIRCCM